MAATYDNLQAVAARIRRAARAAGRDPGEVRLLAVTKTFSAAAIEDALACGLRSFGENYVQEAVEKMDALARSPGLDRLEWHLIGPLQSNKTRIAAQRFDWVQTLDRAKIARRLSEARPADAPPLNVLIQVDVSGEASKSGVPPAEVAALAREVATLPRLRLRGLMTVPEPNADARAQCLPFHAVRELYDSLRNSGLPLDTLSMGMSEDLEAAIAEGATMVRVGTAIFGTRANGTRETRKMKEAA